MENTIIVVDVHIYFELGKVHNQKCTHFFQ